MQPAVLFAAKKPGKRLFPGLLLFFGESLTLAALPVQQPDDGCAAGKHAVL